MIGVHSVIKDWLCLQSRKCGLTVLGRLNLGHLSPRLRCPCVEWWWLQACKQLLRKFWQGFDYLALLISWTILERKKQQNLQWSCVQLMDSVVSETDLRSTVGFKKLQLLTSLL